MLDDLDRARLRLREVFELAREVRAVQFLPNSLSAAAVVAGDAGRSAEVARLIGAADRLREDTGVRMAFRLLTPVVERAAETARSALGDDEYAAAYAMGRAAGLVGAVDLALEVLGEQVAALR